MKKMDLYKTNVIKARHTINSGKPIPLSGSQFSEHDKNLAKIEERVKKVSEDSYRKGLSDGIEFEKKESLPALAAVAEMAKMIPLIRKETIEKTEERIIMLSIAMAEKIINQEVQTRKEIILGVLKGALKNIVETDGMKIRINPQDYRYVMEVKNDFLQSLSGLSKVEFEEDASIKRGGAIVETMFGEVDARIESQLKEIQAAMLNQQI